ncbi:MAG: A/G-specific adenine glycosylase [Prolixibacteraceae bacterium]|nr:A/G-specific adenine glycosylase [Prolixibacteraceae bacterium]
MEILVFRKKVLKWYAVNKRELPWRNITNPYCTWISEIILQQTRVEQGTAYYNRFIEQFPTAESLAKANEQAVLKAWQGLGYYSRARNLHEAAKQLSQYNYKLPEKYETLLTLKGIGPYTASAIASIAFNKPVAAADGNVGRVLSRYFGIQTPEKTNRWKKEISKLAQELIDPEQPGNFNQALMELGALVCSPQNADCLQCPLKSSCYAHKNSMVKKFPVKAKKAKLKNRYFSYLVIDNGDELLFNKRNNNDIWKNLYDFPLIETSTPLAPEAIHNNSLWKNMFAASETTVLNVSGVKKHLLSHQRLFIRFYYLSAPGTKNLPVQFHTINKKDIFDLPVPKVIENYLLEMFHVHIHLLVLCYCLTIKSSSYVSK